MYKVPVCKTIAAYPRLVVFLCVISNEVREVADIPSLADLIARAAGKRFSGVLIKNEVFGDIVLLHGDDARPDEFCECERLSAREVHQLAQCLQGLQGK
ncbi:MAG: hypothetical protein IT406_01485 [Candidatus Yanofskybacteria bacterium]|nr:hypothetical protein [Candidatus Yanofskybacteria bacterium]